jgi:hypothetical protein
MEPVGLANLTNIRSTVNPIQYPSSPSILIDSGATCHFFQVAYNLLHVIPSSTLIAVTLPDGSIINSNQAGLLPILGLPISTHHVHVFLSLKSHSRLSIGQLCDHGCTIIFTKHHIAVTLLDNIVLTGTQSTTTLDPVPLSIHMCPHSANSIIFGSINATLNNETISNQITFFHISLFSLALSTW